MRARTVLALVLLLVLAACGGDAGTSGTSAVTQTTSAYAPGATTPEAGAPETTPEPTAAPEAATLRYGYEDGEQLGYAFTQNITQHMTIDAAGAGQAGIPGDTDTAMTMEGSIAVTSTELAGGGTRVRFAMDIERLSGQITAGDERIDLSDPALADQLTSIPLEYEVVIDEQGRVVDLAIEAAGASVDVTPWLELFGGDTSGLMGGFANETMFGIPAFPEGPVEVGTTWEVDNSQEVFGLSIEASAVYTVTAIEGDVVTIDVQTSVGSLSMSSDDLIEMLTALSDEQMAEVFGTPISAGDIEQVFGMLSFEMRSEPSSGTGTVRFNMADGVTISSSTSMDQIITMVMTIPDESTGEMMEMALDMEQSVAFELELLSPGSA